MTSRRDTVLQLWQAAEDRDWTTYTAHFAPDVVCQMPQTRELVRGRETWVRLNAEYPGDWHVEVQRVIADAGGAVSWVEARIGEHVETGGSFFGFDDEGLVDSIVDFWPEPYDPPAGREHLVERY